MPHVLRAFGAALIAASLLSGCARPKNGPEAGGGTAAGHGDAEDGRYVGTWSGGNAQACGGRFVGGGDPVAIRVVNGQIGIPTRTGNVIPATIEPGGAIRAYDTHSMSWITGSVRNGRLSVRVLSSTGGHECSAAYSAQRAEPQPVPGK